MKRDQMIALLVDMSLVEAYYSLYPPVNDSLKQETADLYATVYKIHHTTKSNFDKSLLYYSKHPELLDTIYNHVRIQLDEKEKKEMKTFNSTK